MTLVGIRPAERLGFLLRCALPTILAVVFAALGPVNSVSAQQTESRIIGKVVDQSEAALPGVSVEITSKNTGAVRSTVTDGDGGYVVTSLSPGTYVVKIELSGFDLHTREVVLGVGQIETIDASLGVAGVSEVVTVEATAVVLDVSAKIGVNVSPEEVENLPVNGRNFANLMTLATGATSDGNGGWASVRFNGKSNQQNYLNYDGVDGTYVWDASPGYLNATGSQFRLQTSMESVAEFRVNSGLAPAESGLGAGGNITVVSKSGSNAFRGSLFEYKRDDALDAASKFDDQKQKLELDQFGGSIGGPIARNRMFFFGSFEGLRQTTGLAFTEAVPSDEARRRILAGENSGGAGTSAERTQAVAPLLDGFPRGTVPTASPLLALATNVSEANQEENTLSFRVDNRFTDNHSFYARYLFSEGDLDTPDRTATPRRVLAEQQPQNLVLNFQSILNSNLVNEFKVGYNRPQTSAVAFGPAGYPATHVSLTGTTATSASIDGRGQTNVARSGLQLRATSAASGGGSFFEPQSLAFSDTVTWSMGAHTFKGGGEYRRIEGTFQFLGGTEWLYNSVSDFIDNKPARYQNNADSPVFHPQQAYLIGFMQDSWRASSRLTLELGLRYDYYSVVKERDDLAKPFFIEDNNYDPDPENFYNADKNNFSPRLSASFSLDDRTVLRAGFGFFYGPGQFEDRIQPIENYINRIRVNTADVPNNGLQYPAAVSRDFLQIRGYTHERPDEYNIQYGASLSRQMFGDVNLTIGYTGSRGKDMFVRGVSNTLNPVTLQRPVSNFGEVDYKTSGCSVDGAIINGNVINGCGYAEYNALQISATRRFRSGFTGGFQYQYSKNKGTTQGSNEATTAQNTFDFETEDGTNPQDIPHTANASIVYLLPWEGFWSGGWRIGGILNARTGVPLNVTITRGDNSGTNPNIPGGNQRGTQRPDLIPGVDPYLKDGVKWLNPAAFTTPRPGTFGNLPRNFLRGPNFWQFDMMFSKDFQFMDTQGLQFRTEVFNITNRLNYEAPATAFLSGTPGVPFDETSAPFGTISGPLNRTVGLGTARQVQISLRYTF